MGLYPASLVVSSQDIIFKDNGASRILVAQPLEAGDAPDLSLGPKSGSFSLPSRVGLAVADTQGSGCRHLHGFGSLHQLPGLLCPVWPAVAIAFSTSACLQ